MLNLPIIYLVWLVQNRCPEALRVNDRNDLFPQLQALREAVGQGGALEATELEKQAQLGDAKTQTCQMEKKKQRWCWRWCDMMWLDLNWMWFWWFLCWWCFDKILSCFWRFGLGLVPNDWPNPDCHFTVGWREVRGWCCWASRGNNWRSSSKILAGSYNQGWSGLTQGSVRCVRSHARAWNWIRPQTFGRFLF